MEDQPQVREEIRRLKEDVARLKERLAKMHDDLEKAARYRRTFGNRRGRRAQDYSEPHPGRRESDHY